MNGQTEKPRVIVAISLPRELMTKLEDARWEARVSRSKYIVDVLKKHWEKEKR